AAIRSLRSIGCPNYSAHDRSGTNAEIPARGANAQISVVTQADAAVGARRIQTHQGPGRPGNFALLAGFASKPELTRQPMEIANGQAQIFKERLERRGKRDASLQKRQGQKRQRGKRRQGQKPQAGDRHRAFESAQERQEGPQEEETIAETASRPAATSACHQALSRLSHFIRCSATATSSFRWFLTSILAFVRRRGSSISEMVYRTSIVSPMSTAPRNRTRS